MKSLLDLPARPSKRKVPSVCSKCGKSPKDFGSQSYCRPCWQKYNRERIRARARKLIPKKIVDKIRELRFFIDTVPGLKRECTEELAQIAKRYDIEDVK